VVCGEGITENRSKGFSFAVASSGNETLRERREEKRREEKRREEKRREEVGDLVTAKGS
jgi:CelD/BcsL family acetyltransferase involved in cellulose biosynthesis